MLVVTVMKLAWRSLCFRRGAVLLSIAAVSVSVFTLLAAEHLRQSTKQSFNSTVSGIDLIVGPRTSDINLLLTTVFRIGQPTQLMTWDSLLNLRNHENVAWALPISLGDSHKGFRVVGTEALFFKHFKYGQSRALNFAHGEPFSGEHDIVLGAQVAQRLGYRLGDKVILSHGIAKTSFTTHDTHPFKVSGILATTGTPVDNALYVSLTGLEAMHSPSGHHEHEASLEHDTDTPESVSAVMLGLTSKLATFKVQREINQYQQEPLTAILPGVALTQLWQMSRGIESGFALMTKLILFASLLGLGAMMLTSLRERYYEFSVLRLLGAGSGTVFVLIELESLLVAGLGILGGFSLFVLTVLLGAEWVAVNYGVDVGLSRVSKEHGLVILYVIIAALSIAAVPGFLAFKKSKTV